MEGKTIRIDPNQADVQQLAEIPGIGPELAGRIVQARPFEHLEDLQRVSGIGPSLLSRLQPYLELPSREGQPPGDGAALEEDLSFEEQPEMEQWAETTGDDPIAALPAEAATPMQTEPAPPANVPAERTVTADHPDQPVAAVPPKDPQPVVPPSSVAAASQPTGEKPAAPPAPAPRTQPAGVSRGQLWWLVLVSSLMTLILSVALSLAVLANINAGMLRFATPGQVETLTAQIEAARARNDQLTQDLEGLRGRIANLETLGQRVSAVEQVTGELSGDVDALGEQVEENSRVLSQVEEEVSALSEQSERVQTFLQGLRDLLAEVYPSQEGEP